jgi:hypothetical protein
MVQISAPEFGGARTACVLTIPCWPLSGLEVPGSGFYFTRVIGHVQYPHEQAPDHFRTARRWQKQQSAVPRLRTSSTGRSKGADR